MTASLPRLLLLSTTVLGIAGAARAAPLPLCPVTPGQTTSFDIVRSGSVIGHQTIRYTVAGPDMTVDITVAASLRALGVRVYNYDHHGTEHWHNGEMVGLDSKTDDDGTPRQVHAFKDATGWHGVSGPDPGPAPLLSTSLWNSRTVSATRLLDRETGAVVAVRVSPAGDQQLQLGSRTVPAHRFDMAGLVSGTAWYDADGCWVQALFKTRVDGSMVEVRAH